MGLIRESATGTGSDRGTDKREHSRDRKPSKANVSKAKGDLFRDRHQRASLKFEAFGGALDQPSGGVLNWKFL